MCASIQCASLIACTGAFDRMCMPALGIMRGGRIVRRIGLRAVRRMILCPLVDQSQCFKKGVVVHACLPNAAVLMHIVLNDAHAGNGCNVDILSQTVMLACLFAAMTGANDVESAMARTG